MDSELNKANLPTSCRLSDARIAWWLVNFLPVWWCYFYGKGILNATWCCTTPGELGVNIELLAWMWKKSHGHFIRHMEKFIEQIILNRSTRHVGPEDESVVWLSSSGSRSWTLKWILRTQLNPPTRRVDQVQVSSVHEVFCQPATKW